MRFEPAISAFIAVRKKRHGIGEGSRLLALKMALCMFSVSNGGLAWYARAATWMAIHGTPRLPPINRRKH